MAGVLSLLLPAALMVLFIVTYPGELPDFPTSFEVFALFGWIPGFIVLPFALFLAHQLNRRGFNGWVLPPVAGALIGGSVGFLWSAGRLPFFAVESALAGAVYGTFFWAFAHGLSVLTDRTRRP